MTKLKKLLQIFYIIKPFEHVVDLRTCNPFDKVAYNIILEFHHIYRNCSIITKLSKCQNMIGKKNVHTTMTCRVDEDNTIVGVMA